MLEILTSSEYSIILSYQVFGIPKEELNKSFDKICSYYDQEGGTVHASYIRHRKVGFLLLFCC